MRAIQTLAESRSPAIELGAEVREHPKNGATLHYVAKVCQCERRIMTVCGRCSRNYNRKYSPSGTIRVACLIARRRTRRVTRPHGNRGIALTWSVWPRRIYRVVVARARGRYGPLRHRNGIQRGWQKRFGDEFRRRPAACRSPRPPTRERGACDSVREAETRIAACIFGSVISGSSWPAEEFPLLHAALPPCDGAASVASEPGTALCVVRVPNTLLSLSHVAP